MHSKGVRTHENDPIPWCACTLGAREFKGLFTWSAGPRSSGVGFFCFHALGDTRQKKPTPLDRGPPLHVNRVGQCSDCVHARASSVFSSEDNWTVILTRQDFLLDRIADGDLLFTFSSNILDFRHEDSSWFCRYRAASRPENLFPLALKTAFLMWNSCQRSIVPDLLAF